MSEKDLLYLKEVFFERTIKIWKKYNALPMDLLSHEALIYVQNGNLDKNKMQCMKKFGYKIWSDLLLRLSSELNLSWLNPTNMTRLKRRCRLHWKKYKMYLNGMVKIITARGRSMTNISFVSQERVDLPLGSKIVVVKDSNKTEVVGGVYMKLRNTVNDASLEGLEYYTQADFNLKLLPNYQFETGLSMIDWIPIPDQNQEDEVGWIMGIAPMLRLVAAEKSQMLINEDGEASKWLVKLKLFSTTYLDSDKYVSDTTSMTVKVNNGFSDWISDRIKNGGRCTILYQSDNVIVNGKETGKLTKPLNDVMIAYLNAATSLQKDQLQVYNLARIEAQFLKKVDDSLTGLELSQQERIDSIINGATIKSKKRILISAQKGSGKTSFIQGLVSDPSILIIDSDDWGSWLTFLIEKFKVSPKELSEMEISNKEIIRLTSEWFRLIEKPPSIFSLTSQIVMKKWSDEILKGVAIVEEALEDLKSSYASKTKAGQVIMKLYDTVISYFDELTPIIKEIHQQFLNSKVISIRQFQFGMSEIEESKEVRLTIHFVHAPVETNSSLPFEGFLMFKGAIDPTCTLLRRNLLHNRNNILELLVDMGLYLYYDAVTDVRVKCISLIMLRRLFHTIHTGIVELSDSNVVN